MSFTTKFCIDCKHHKKKLFWHLCYLPRITDGVIDSVTGKKYGPKLCKNARVTWCCPLEDWKPKNED